MSQWTRDVKPRRRQFRKESNMQADHAPAVPCIACEVLRDHQQCGGDVMLNEHVVLAAAALPMV
jgi:hypothetical protein